MGQIDFIKNNISIEDVLRLFSITPTRKGSHIMALCPIHCDKNASLEIFKDNKFKCYGCGAYGDVIDLYSQATKLPQNKAIKSLVQKLKLGELQKQYCIMENTFLPTKEKEVRKTPNLKVRKYLKLCMSHIGETDYFQKRGLIPEIINRFKLGYDPKKKTVTIPYSNSLLYYQQRSVVGKMYAKVGSSIAGTEPIFNVKAFELSKIIFIVESPICAMSIHQCGGVAVPLCGVVNVKKLLEYLSENYYEGTLIICLDNDLAGQNATKELIDGIPNYKLQGLNGLKMNYVVENIADECKDPNELLVKNWWRLRLNVQRIIAKIKNA